MSRNRRRSFGFAAITGSALVVACSVDTSGISFLDQDTYDRETMSGTGDVGTGNESSGGEPDVGGSATAGGSSSKAGSSGKSGSGSGGSTPTGGNPSGGTGGSGATGGKAGAGAGAGGSAGFGGGGGLPPGGGPAGGMGMGGQMQCPHIVANRGAPLIDDFEDGNAGLPLPMQAGRAGGWYVTNDGTGQQMPPADPTKPPNPLQNIFPSVVDMSKFALHTQGGGFMQWGADVGVSFLTIPNSKLPCPYDISPHTGLRFSVRGSVSDDLLRISVLTVETDTVEQGGTCMPLGAKMCDDHYSYLYGPITNTWTVVSIPFNKLAQQQFGVPADFVPQHALGIELGVHAMTTFDLWIDDVQFY